MRDADFSLQGPGARSIRQLRFASTRPMISEPKIGTSLGTPQKKRHEEEIEFAPMTWQFEKDGNPSFKVNSPRDKG